MFHRKSRSGGTGKWRGISIMSGSERDDILSRTGLRAAAVITGDVELLALCSNAVALSRDIDNLIATASAVPRWRRGRGSLQIRIDCLTSARVDVVDRLSATPARTLCGLRAKAEVLLLMLRDSGRLDAVHAEGLLANVTELLGGA
jgi:hypothetical protein